MCPCNRECRTTTTAQMAGTPPLQLLLKDLLVAANRCACHDDPDPAQLACLTRSCMQSLMQSAMRHDHDVYFFAPFAAPQRLRLIRARDSHAHRVSVCSSRRRCPVMRELAGRLSDFRVLSK